MNLNLIKNSSAFFALRKFYHYKMTYSVNPNLTPHKNYLNQLLKDGYLVIENFFEPAVIEAIVEEIHEPLMQVKEGTYKGPCARERFVQEGTYRLKQIDTISETSKQFYEHAMINSLARAYVAPNVQSYVRMAELKVKVDGLKEVDLPHMDDWKHRFKAFLYLSDVGERQAPFVFYKGSTIQGMWRFRKELEHRKYGGPGPILTPSYLAYFSKKYGFEERIITGKAGTLILFDGRGIHRGTPLREGSRMVMANYFDCRG